MPRSQSGPHCALLPGFRARSTDKELGVDTALEVRYSADHGRYVIDAATNRSVRMDVEINYPTVAKVRMQGIVQAAAPNCIFLTLDDESTRSQSGSA